MPSPVNDAECSIIFVWYIQFLGILVILKGFKDSECTLDIKMLTIFTGYGCSWWHGTFRVHSGQVYCGEYQLIGLLRWVPVDRFTEVSEYQLTDLLRWVFQLFIQNVVLIVYIQLLILIFKHWEKLGCFRYGCPVNNSFISNLLFVRRKKETKNCELYIVSREPKPCKSTFSEDAKNYMRSKKRNQWRHQIHVHKIKTTYLNILR